MLIAIGSLLLIAVLSSTRQGRGEAKARLAPYEKWIAFAAVILWGMLLLPMLLPDDR